MRARWQTWAAVVALGAPACAIRQHQEVTVVVQHEAPLRGDATGAISLGESPGDLTAAQINAALDGYGAWVDSAAYGRIWRPDEALVDGAFLPYASAGQWVATDGGWYWQSDYPWGRVAFHHGRWVRHGSVWAWVPGSRFAPAWVDWRVGGGWVGWAALAPIGARAWGPFVYCAHGALAGPGVDRRLVRGAAGSSLYGRTAAVADDGGVPRGPAAQPRTFAVVPLAQAWRAPAPAMVPARPRLAVASAAGIDAVARIPVARVIQAPPAVETPAGGAALVIRDRDLAGMSEGPSVRRPAGALPDPVIQPRPRAVVVVPPAAPRLAAAAPPPLPPPPDGVAYGAYPGVFPMRRPMAHAARRGPSPGAPVVLAAPAPRAAAPPVAQPRTFASTGASTGASIGSPAGRPTAAPTASTAPLSSVR